MVLLLDRSNLLAAVMKTGDAAIGSPVTFTLIAGLAREVTAAEKEHEYSMKDIANTLGKFDLASLGNLSHEQKDAFVDLAAKMESVGDGLNNLYNLKPSEKEDFASGAMTGDSAIRTSLFTRLSLR